MRSLKAAKPIGLLAIVFIALLAVALYRLPGHKPRIADEENPFRNAKIGDWFEYQFVYEFDNHKSPPMSATGNVRITVTAKDDHEAIVEMTGKMARTAPVLDNEDLTPQTRKIDLSKPYDLISFPALPELNNAIVDTDGDGNEKVKVGDKEYDCSWQELKVTSSSGAIAEDVKVWQSKDVPLSGIVKIQLQFESRVEDAKTTLELTGWGGK
jgi:hypothetical protein